MTVTTAAGPVSSAAAAPRWRRLSAPALAAATFVAAAGALRLRDPHVSGSWGTCAFLQVTGLPCPVCGGLRAVNDLTRGDVVAAAGSNVLVLLAVPVVVGWLVLWARRAARTPAPSGWAVVPLPRARTLVLVVAAVCAFGVLRWLPFAAVLAP